MKSWRKELEAMKARNNSGALPRLPGVGGIRGGGGAVYQVRRRESDGDGEKDDDEGDGESEGDDRRRRKKTRAAADEDDDEAEEGGSDPGSPVVEEEEPEEPAESAEEKAAREAEELAAAQVARKARLEAARQKQVSFKSAPSTPPERRTCYTKARCAQAALKNLLPNPIQPTHPPYTTRQLHPTRLTYHLPTRPHLGRPRRRPQEG